MTVGWLANGHTSLVKAFRVLRKCLKHANGSKLRTFFNHGLSSESQKKKQTKKKGTKTLLVAIYWTFEFITIH